MGLSAICSPAPLPFPAASAAELRRRFVADLRGRYVEIEADRLTSDAFPTSFLPSAGPNLASHALLERVVPIRWDRVCVLQPCIRYWDLAQVGDGRHLSCFEMATLVSPRQNDRHRILADLFGWLVDGIGLHPASFWVTVYGTGPVAGQSFAPDTEAMAIWRSLGLPAERIVPVAGIEGFVANRQEAVGGYRTEIYCEVAAGCQGRCSPCSPGASDCGRFVEVATAVTYAFAVDLDARPAIRPVDGPPVHAAGFGVERVLQVVAGYRDIAEVDTVARVRTAIAQACHGGHLEHEPATTIAADHLKAVAFLAADGATHLPGRSNKGRRWIINRYAGALRAAAVRLGLREGWSDEVLAVLSEVYAKPYPRLAMIGYEEVAWVRSLLGRGPGG